MIYFFSFLAASLSRVDPNRMSEMSSRNMSDLQRQVKDQNERLNAVFGQLDKFGKVVDTLRRESRAQVDDISRRIQDVTCQLSMVKVSSRLAKSVSVTRPIY